MIQFTVSTTPLNDANCHRATFGESKRTTIKVVSTPCDGDVVLYRDASGKVVHSGVMVGGLVRSKWGNGPVVLHSIEDCFYNHGDVRFYRYCDGQARATTTEAQQAAAVKVRHDERTPRG